MPPLYQLFQLLALTLTLTTVAVPAAEGKRFDCRLFCRETGFRGMLGGCRCSFTLFTAKRAIRDPIEENDTVLRALSHLLPQYQTIKNPLRSSHDEEGEVYQPSMNILPNYITKSSGKDVPSSGSASKLPGYPSRGGDGEDYDQLARAAAYGMMLQQQNALNKEGSSSSSSSSMTSALHDNSKRREFEMQLDNGETADVLRMPY